MQHLKRNVQQAGSENGQPFTQGQQPFQQSQQFNQQSPMRPQQFSQSPMQPQQVGQGTQPYIQQTQPFVQGTRQPVQQQNQPHLQQPFAQRIQQSQQFLQGVKQSVHYGEPYSQSAANATSADNYFTQSFPDLAQAGQFPQNGWQSASQAFSSTANQSKNFESVLVKIVLPIVFVVVLLIGILMLFIAGIAYGLLTEPVRCLLGLMLATFMYIFGMLQQRFKRPIWGRTLLGGAHGVLIITVSIAHLSYEIIGVFVALLAYALTFALITFSAIRWRSQLLVTIAIISGYLCMFLVDLSKVYIIAFILIQLLFSICMMVLSSKLNYRVAYSFAYLLLHFSLLITYNIQEYSTHKLLLAALAIQHVLVFISFIRRKLILIEQMIVQIIGSIALISWAAQLYNLPGGISLTYSLVNLIIAIMYGCILLYFERELAQLDSNEHAKLYHSLWLRTEVSTIIIAIALLCFFVELLGISFIGLIMFLIGTTIVLYGMRDEHPVLRWVGALFTFIGGITILFDFPSKLISYENLSWIVMLISLLLIYRECHNDLDDTVAKPILLPVLMWLEAVLLFIFVTIIADLIGEKWGTASSYAYIISAAWLIYALGAIIIGAVRKLSKARLTGIILLLVILIKVIFIDMTFLNMLAKSLIFTVLGGIGILVSFFLYNRTDDAGKSVSK